MCRELTKRFEEVVRGSAAELDALAGVDPRQRYQGLRGDSLVHQQRLHRIAGTVALRLGVVGDADRHVDVGIFVDEHMTDAIQMLDHRYRGFVGHPLDQAFAAPRHQYVDVTVHRREHAHSGAVGSRDRLHRILRQAGGGEAFVQACGDRLIRAHRFGAAAQDRRVARFETQRGGVGSDVRP